MSLEEEKEAEKLATIKKITQLQDELNEVLVKVSELAEKEIRFAEMQEELLTWGKKYDEVIYIFELFSIFGKDKMLMSTKMLR